MTVAATWLAAEKHEDIASLSATDMAWSRLATLGAPLHVEGAVMIAELMSPSPPRKIRSIIAVSGR